MAKPTEDENRPGRHTRTGSEESVDQETKPDQLDAQDGDAPPRGPGDAEAAASAPDPKRPKYGRRQPLASVEKLPPKLSCGTASGRGFFVAHPDHDTRPIVMLVKPDGGDLEEEDWFLVDAEVEDDLADIGTMYELVLCRTANGGYFLWRLRTEEPGGRIDGYTESAREALEEHAGEHWIKLKGDRKSRAYEVIRGSQVAVIRWPEFGIDELVRRAFKGRVITSEDHDLIRRLRGDI
jgi:hypothetical protein